jgi:hypothetical protein
MKTLSVLMPMFRAKTQSSYDAEPFIVTRARLRA